MFQLNKREKRILSITIASFGIFCVGSGLIMNSKVKPVIHTNYSVSVESRKIAQTQAKTNEIKLKEITIEINNPISVDIKDYLEDVDKISNSTIKSLKLDTSLVNINQAGTYQYTITYKKKKYVGNVIVKEKELPNITINLKTIKLKTGDSLSSNPRTFIEGEIPDEVYNNLILDISKVDVTTQGDYVYLITYKGVTYQGKVEVRDPGPTIITNVTCPDDALKKDNTCECTDSNKTYDESSKKCIAKSDKTE